MAEVAVSGDYSGDYSRQCGRGFSRLVDSPMVRCIVKCRRQA